MDFIAFSFHYRCIIYCILYYLLLTLITCFKQQTVPYTRPRQGLLHAFGYRNT